MTGIPLRRRLFVLTVAAILPLAVLAGTGLYALRRQRDAQTERVGRELARSVANAIDSELRSLIGGLEMLATTPTLDRNDFTGFRERADRIVRLKRDWAAIVLADASGRLVLDTRYPDGRALPPIAEMASFDLVVRTGAPAVGSLNRDAQEEWLFAVRVPAIRDNTVKYVVSALVRPGAIRDVLTRQQVPGDWVISIVDAKGLRVARSRAHEETLGGRLSATVQRVVDRGGADGFGLAYTLEGERIFTPYSRLMPSGWMAVLGLPTALVDAATYRSIAVYGGGVLLSIALGTIGALWVARSITRPIGGLRAAAEALGRRQSPVPPETSIQEIREVGAALKSAAEELTKAEAERENLLRKEREAREAAETADRAKEAFMTVLSHELRTPINAVFGWARMLQGGQLRDDATVTRAKDAIVRNADILVQLIDELLDLSRIASGKMRLEIGTVDMPGMLRAAIDAVRPAADAKTIRIHTAFDADAGPIKGDPARLQQVAWNLLINAVKFTPQGGEIRLVLRRVGSDVQIVVSDTGHGIAPDMLPHVFERFRQADSSSTRAHGGLGLGLALVRHLVELHGGTVVAHSAGPGQGATFIVTLPIAIANVSADPFSRVPASSPTGGPVREIVRLDGLHVLVTDDDGESLAIAEAILAGAGAHVRTCRSAAAALELLRHWRPDVLVSDIEMPDEDGYTLIRNVRALAPGDGGQTPAIALTAYGRPQDRLRCLTAGFNMHVPKPVDPGELTAIIAGVAGTSEQSQAL